MDNDSAILSLAALAQPTRLEAFRLLIRYEPHGLPAGEISRLLAVPQNTMSAHLSVLSRAKLIEGDRQSRSIIYRANLEEFKKLTAFLLEDCCGERFEICDAQHVRSKLCC
jgi:ArsR family transcriptional regulator, arsenate/arsenite/antimonite-responsive transcriptional repressor